MLVTQIKKRVRPHDLVSRSLRACICGPASRHQLVSLSPWPICIAMPSAADWATINAT